MMMIMTIILMLILMVIDVQYYSETSMRMVKVGGCGSKCRSTKSLCWKAKVFCGNHSFSLSLSVNASMRSTPKHRNCARHTLIDS